MFRTDVFRNKSKKIKSIKVSAYIRCSIVISRVFSTLFLCQIFYGNLYRSCRLFSNCFVLLFYYCYLLCCLCFLCCFIITYMYLLLMIYFISLMHKIHYQCFACFFFFCIMFLHPLMGLAYRTSTNPTNKLKNLVTGKQRA